jgi:LAO/AO transport system kinase
MSAVRRVGRHNPDALREAAKGGDRLALARLLTLVEQGEPGADLPFVTSPGPLVVGITGPPGAGKSTLVASLVAAYRHNGNRVAVLAVDPTSPDTGGAVLGDRVRMQAHYTDEGTFIRSVASRGRVGGLSAAVPGSLRVLAEVGFDVVIVETVGLGQVGFDIAAVAPCVVLVMVPGLGDDVQAVKAGVLEIADVVVVNKADLPGASLVAADLRSALLLRDSPGGNDWVVPILQTIARNGDGVDELMEEINRHSAWMIATSELQVRVRHGATHELRNGVDQLLRERVDALCASPLFADRLEQVLRGEAVVSVIAEELVRQFGAKDPQELGSQP